MTPSTRSCNARRAPGLLAGALLVGLLIGCSEEPAPTTERAVPEPERGQGKAPEPAPQAPARPAPPQARDLSVDERIRAIEELPFGEDDPEAAVWSLKWSLGDPDLDVREATVMALAAVDSEEASAELAAHIRVERDSMLKNDMIDELLDREAPQTLDALLFLLGDPDPEVRERAAEGLDELDDPRAIPGLHDALRGESDEGVRDTMLFALETLDPDFDPDFDQDAWEELE